MNKQNLLVVVFLVMSLLPISAQASDFDGSEPFVAVVIEAYDCTANAQCKPVAVQSLDCPRFLKVNVPKKIIVGTLEDQSSRDVEIKSTAHIDGNLILQGVQKGRAWSLVISEATGKMTLSVSGQSESFVFFGESFFQ